MKPLLQKILFLLCLSAATIVGSSFILNASAQTQQTVGAFPRNLTVGDYGGDVFSLQALLIAQDSLKVAAPTGYFGPLTAAAVANWQASVGLPSTGYFGMLSRDELAGVAIAPTANESPAQATTITATTTSSSSVVAPPASVPAFTSAPSIVSTPSASAPAPTTATYTRNFSIGDSGADISSLQSTLIAQGYLPIANPTGYFGQLTSEALAKWQTASGLPGTGYFGPLTRAKLQMAKTASADLAAQTATDATDATGVAEVPSPATQTQSAQNIAPAFFGGGGGGGGGGGTNVPISLSPSVPVSQPIVIQPVSAPQSPATSTPPVIVPPPPPADTTPPTVPTKLVLSATTHTTIALSWTASTDNVGVAGYRVFRNGSQIGMTIDPIYNDVGLSPGTLYSYTVSAFDDAGNISGQSAKTSASTLAVTVASPPPLAVPTTPQNLLVTTTTASTASLSWLPSTESGGSITKYIIYRDSAQVGVVTQTSFTDTSLKANTSYEYVVVAYDAKGTGSSISNIVTAITQALPPPPTSTSTTNTDFGISVGSNFLALSTTTQNQELNAMTTLGVAWLRFDMQWKIIQSQNSSTYNWSQIDTLVTEANAHHIKVLAILDYAPAWAAASGCAAGTNCPPASPTAFAAFATAAVQRYTSKGVTDYEIWNEPNNADFWGSKSDCVAYTADLKAAYTAIKSVAQNDGVITGGLAPEASNGKNISPTDFLSCIYNNGGGQYFDAVGDHPYSYPQMPSDSNNGTWSQMSATTPSLRSIMTANGDAGKNIWVTEFGAPTNGPNPSIYISEAQQAAMVMAATNLYKTYSWAGPFFWYTIKDTGTATTTDENFFGLTRPDGSLKPAYTTLQTIISTGL